MFGRERAPLKKTSGRWLDKCSVCQIWNRPIIFLNYQWGQMVTVQPVPFGSFFVTTKPSPQLLARHWLVQSQSESHADGRFQDGFAGNQHPRWVIFQQENVWHLPPYLLALTHADAFLCSSWSRWPLTLGGLLCRSRTIPAARSWCSRQTSARESEDKKSVIKAPCKGIR